jgi:hypothetical protein
MLVTHRYINHLAAGGLTAANTALDIREDRMFLHLDYSGNRWTWELHEAHWWDHLPEQRVFIGRWPD